MTHTNQNTTSKKITVEFCHDTREGWACKEWLLNGKLIATDDGSDMVYHTRNAEELELLQDYIDEHGQGTPDWDAYNEALIADQAAQLRIEHADDIVLVRNSYESETDCGFANTYYIETACEGDQSPHSWQTAKKVSEIGTEFDAELVAWAQEEQIDTIINWF